MQQNQRTTTDNGGVRAAPARMPASAGLTTDRMLAVLLVVILLALYVIRRGFGGALGD